MSYLLISWNIPSSFLYNYTISKMLVATDQVAVLIVKDWDTWELFITHMEAISLRCFHYYRGLTTIGRRTISFQFGQTKKSCQFGY